MTRPLRSMFCAVAVVAAALPLAADTLVLKNGNRFQGTVIRETADEVTLRGAGGETTFKRAQIRSIKKEAGGADASSEAAPASAPSPSGDDLDFDSLPQSRPVTLDVKNEPLFDIVGEIQRQSGGPLVAADGLSQKRLDLKLQKASFWRAVADVCRQADIRNLEYVQESGVLSVHLGPFMSEKPRGKPRFDARGPFLFIWDGLIDDQEFDFSKSPAQAVDRAWVRLRLMIDPSSEVSIEPNVLPPVTLRMPGGRSLTVKPEHEVQTAQGGRKWKFAPTEELKTAPLRIEGVVPVHTATRLHEATVDAKPDATARSGDVTITVKSWKRSGDEIAVSVFMIYAKEVQDAIAKEQQALMERIGQERRGPTPEEQRRLDAMLGAGALAARGIVLTAAGGASLDAPADRESGFSGPPIGYTYKAAFRAPEGFVPKSVTVRYLTGYRRVEVPFRIE